MIEPLTTATVILSVASPVVVHVLKKFIDEIWPSARTGENVTAATGRIFEEVYERPEANRHDALFEEYFLASVQGRYFVPSSVDDTLGSNCVAFFVVEELTTGSSLILTGSVGNGYYVQLPAGIYHMCVFLLDGSASEPEQAYIFAIGLPSRIHLSTTNRIEGREEEIFRLVREEPVELSEGLNALDFLFFAPHEYDGVPRRLCEF